MEEKKMTRRETMVRLTKIIAMAAGVSTMQVRRLFGLEKATSTKELKPVQKVTPTKKLKPVRKAVPLKKAPNIQKIKSIKARKEKVKMLKVMLHNKRSVFENEFGRETPKYTVRDIKSIPGKYRDFLRGFDIRPGMIICEVEWVGAGENLQCDMGLVCGTNFFSGMGAVSANCSDNGACNLCNFGCGGEAHLMCPEQNCPGVNCGPSNYYNNSDEFTDTGFFNRYRTDPYIQALFQEFQVNTSQALAQEIKSMLNAR